MVKKGIKESIKLFIESSKKFSRVDEILKELEEIKVDLEFDVKEALKVKKIWEEKLYLTQTPGLK